MKVLVTGAAGFIGSTLCRRLLELGYSVVGVDLLTDYYDPAVKRKNVASLTHHRGFSFIEADLNLIALEPLIGDVEYVFHQAGQPGVRKSWGSDFGLYLEQNVGVTQRLLEAAKSAPDLKKFVYASSSSVYGDAEKYPTAETDRPMPRSPYGVTKLAGEHLATLYASNYGVPTVALRYFTVYGPGQRPDMAFNRFIRAALGRQPITIFGDGEQVRDFTYVDDVVEANIKAAEVPTRPGDVFNVAGGSNTSVNEVLQMLEELAGVRIDRNWKAPVAGDVRRTGGATQKIQRQLGWSPSTPLVTGLGSELEWMRTSLGLSRDLSNA